MTKLTLSGRVSK